jgi:hypothetical protein
VVRKKRKEIEKGKENGSGGCWAGLAGLGPGSAQLGYLPLFFVLNPFLFLISYFLHGFCILHPNKVKPLSKFFVKKHSKVLNQYETCFQN